MTPIPAAVVEAALSPNLLLMLLRSASTGGFVAPTEWAKIIAQVEHITAAPAEERVRELERDLVAENAMLKSALEVAKAAQSRIAALEAERDRMREALKFYAGGTAETGHMMDPEDHEVVDYPDGSSRSKPIRFGTLARAALAQPQAAEEDAT